MRFNKYYYRARYYDPKKGRFINEDPIGFASKDKNQFRYAGNNSSRNKDPNGENWIDDGVCYILTETNPDVQCGSATETITDAACRALGPKLCTPKPIQPNPEPDPEPTEPEDPNSPSVPPKACFELS